MDIKQERLDMAVNNILSGVNACGTLAKAVENGDGKYFRAAIAPIVDAYEEEAAALRRQRDVALADAETKRFALESIASNMTIPPGPMRDAIGKALPGRRV